MQGRWNFGKLKIKSIKDKHIRLYSLCRNGITLAQIEDRENSIVIYPFHSVGENEVRETGPTVCRSFDKDGNERRAAQ